jgi:hypothetical protein
MRSLTFTLLEERESLLSAHGLRYEIQDEYSGKKRFKHNARTLSVVH